jgi:multicomponent Na+:H+ antiporter subunit E
VPVSPDCDDRGDVPFRRVGHGYRPTVRVLALFAWCFLAWLMLAWMLTAESLIVGVAVSLAVALATAPLGEVVGPWAFLRPTRLAALVRLGAALLGRIVVANVRLSSWVWRSGRPPASGMVEVPTQLSGSGAVAVTGLLSSLVVDNQIVDVDLARRRLLYHALDVPTGGADAAYDEVNGPIEARLRPLVQP